MLKQIQHAVDEDAHTRRALFIRVLTLLSITATFVHILRPIRGRTVEPPDSIFDDGGFCVLWGAYKNE